MFISETIGFRIEGLGCGNISKHRGSNAKDHGEWLDCWSSLSEHFINNVQGRVFGGCFLVVVIGLM